MTARQLDRLVSLDAGRYIDTSDPSADPFEEWRKGKEREERRQEERDRRADHLSALIQAGLFKVRMGR